MAALDALLDGPLDWLAYMKVTARFDRQAVASVAAPRSPQARRTSTMQAVRARLVSGKTQASAVEALQE
jgi:hypothetical protein